MKKAFILLTIILTFSACSKEEEDTLQGCMTGIPKTENYRVQIRCCTRQQFLAGDNVAAGGTSNFTSYTQVKWEKCSQCK